MAQVVKRKVQKHNLTVDGLVKLLIDQKLTSIYTALPAKVLKFYPEEMRADVQPLVAIVNEQGVEVPNSSTSNIPIIYPESKDIYVRHPLVPGDLVWVQYSTVALDDILASTNPVVPKSIRRFSQKDGVILGGYRYDEGSKTLAGRAEDLIIHRRSTNTTVSINKSGDVEIIGAKNVNVQAESVVTLDVPQTVITGNLSIQGAATVASTMVVTGAVTGGKMETSSGISLEDHTHNYRPGPGGPTPTSKPS